MKNSAARYAHMLCTNNREALASANLCGCFFCIAIFSPIEIEEWVPEVEHGPCITALCPKCGIDSVIPDTEDYPISVKFLSDMKKVWF